LAALNIRAILARLTTYAETLGIFDAVFIGNSPTTLPASGLACAISVTSLTPSVAFSGLSSTSCVLTCNVRIYKNKMTAPIDLVDVAVWDAAEKMYGQLHTSVGLSGDAVVTDIFQIERIEMTAISGFVPGDSGFYQVVDLTVPIIFEDVWVQNG